MNVNKTMHEALTMIAEFPAEGGSYNFGYVQGIAVATLAAVEKASENTEIHTENAKALSGRKPYRTVTDDDIKKMKTLADRGVKQSAIARACNISPANVSRYLKDYNRRKTDEPGKGTIDWIRELASEGLSTEEIAERTNYTTGIVAKFAGREE